MKSCDLFHNFIPKGLAFQRLQGASQGAESCFPISVFTAAFRPFLVTHVTVSFREPHIYMQIAQCIVQGDGSMRTPHEGENLVKAFSSVQRASKAGTSASNNAVQLLPSHRDTSALIPPQREAMPEGRLDSWKEIASYFGREVRTVQRWEKRESLPVHRHIHNRIGSIYAFKSELDDWLKSRSSFPKPLAPNKNQRARSHGASIRFAQQPDPLRVRSAEKSPGQWTHNNSIPAIIVFNPESLDLPRELFSLGLRKLRAVSIATRG